MILYLTPKSKICLVLEGILFTKHNVARVKWLLGILDISFKAASKCCKCLMAPASSVCSGDPTLLEGTKLSKQLKVDLSILDGLTTVM